MGSKFHIFNLSKKVLLCVLSLALSLFVIVFHPIKSFASNGEKNSVTYKCDPNKRAYLYKTEREEGPTTITRHDDNTEYHDGNDFICEIGLHMEFYGDTLTVSFAPWISGSIFSDLESEITVVAEDWDGNVKAKFRDKEWSFLNYTTEYWDVWQTDCIEGDASIAAHPWDFDGQFYVDTVKVIN